MKLFSLKVPCPLRIAGDGYYELLIVEMNFANEAHLSQADF